MPRGNLKNFGDKAAKPFRPQKAKGSAREIVPSSKGTGTRVAGAKTATSKNVAGARVTRVAGGKGTKR